MPETIRLIPAATDGQVEERYLLPGVPVKANTAILLLQNPELQQAALDAVHSWRYRPYLLNNDPVEVETTINVIFSLGG